jgi:hypothetical protein
VFVPPSQSKRSIQNPSTLSLETIPVDLNHSFQFYVMKADKQTKVFASFSEKEGRKFHYNPFDQVATWTRPDNHQPVSPDLQDEIRESNRVTREHSEEEPNAQEIEPIATASRSLDLEDNPPNLQKTQDKKILSLMQTIDRVYNNKLMLLGVFCIWMWLKSAWEEASRPAVEADSSDPLEILRRVETSYCAIVGDENFKSVQRAAPSLNFDDLASKLRQGEEIVRRVAIAKNITDAAAQRRMKRMMTPWSWRIPKAFCIWIMLKLTWEEASRPAVEDDSRDPLEILRRVETSYSAIVGDENFKSVQRAASSVNFDDLASTLRQGEEIVRRVAIAKNVTDAAAQRRMKRMEVGNKFVNHIWDDMVLI